MGQIDSSTFRLSSRPTALLFSAKRNPSSQRRESAGFQPLFPGPGGCLRCQHTDSGAPAADASSNIKRVRLKTSFAARYPPCTSQRANFPRPSPSPTSVKYVDARYETFRLVACTFLRLRRVSRERHERTREQGEGERESESAFDPFEERRLGTKGERQRRNFNSPGLFSTCTPTAVQSRPFSHPFSLSPPSLPPPVRPALSGQIDFS